MKFSSISLVGALVAIVVGAIATPVPRSLKQLNLFEHDIDGELVDGLFTRNNPSAAHKSYVKLGEGHFNAAQAHRNASEAHTEAARLTGDQRHITQAYHHGTEAQYHHTQCTFYLNIAPKALAETRTDDEKGLLKHQSQVFASTKRCREDADRSKEYAMAIIEHYHGRGGCPAAFISPTARHHGVGIGRGGYYRT